MIDETILVLLAFGTLGLLGSFLLFQRISRAVRVNRILKGGNRILKAGGPWEPSRPAREGWTAGLKGPFARTDKATEQTFRNVFFTAANKGEGLIEYYMTKHKCGRTEAMKHAIEEREKDERRYG
jgi:hypothetical protein